MLKIETLEKMMNDPDWRVRADAMTACKGRDVPPIELIEKGLNDPDWRVRVYAMNACVGRDVPLALIEKGASDSDWHVRMAAMTACVGRRDISPNRTFEPPKKVYKQCVGGVIVVAHIPKDAHVRGHKGEKCRASKAEIVDIIGDLYGERIGVSRHDPNVEYRVGDVVEIKNFDFSYNQCSSGFHFFCSLKEAQNYEY